MKYLRIAWQVLPLILAAVIVFLIWFRPPGGGGALSTGTVIVAGKKALTDEAEKWGTDVRECPPPTGSSAPTVKVVFRDAPQAEIDRLARQYAAFLVAHNPQNTPTTSPAPISGPVPSPGSPTLRLGAVFGEYEAPTLPYGGTFLAALDKDTGEHVTIFDPAPAPKFRFNWVYGGGAFYDFSSTSGDAVTGQDNRLYLFLEPFQTKHLYWRLSGGVHQTPESWEPFFGVGAEWRTDPWVKKSRRGLKAIPLPP